MQDLMNKCNNWKYIVPQLAMTDIDDLKKNFIDTILKVVFPSQTTPINSILALFQINSVFVALVPHIHIYLTSKFSLYSTDIGITDTKRGFNLYEYIDNLDFYSKIFINSKFNSKFDSDINARQLYNIK